jgi:ATP-dependent RNA helicase DDX24/MAK5
MYLLRSMTGRTIVFANSINSIRRLTSTLALLGLPVYPLHAEMQQRQRLKNLERFKTLDQVVLVATDVAARGLDIALVKQVVHYHLPPTAEVCDDSSAAAHSPLLLSAVRSPQRPNSSCLCRRSKYPAGGARRPDEVRFRVPVPRQRYALEDTLGEGAGLVSLRLISGMTEDLPDFPVAPSQLSLLRKCVLLAKKLERMQHSTRVATADVRWAKTNAQAMDVPSDDDAETDKAQGGAKTQEEAHAADWKEQLARLLHTLPAPPPLPTAALLETQLQVTRPLQPPPSAPPRLAPTTPADIPFGSIPELARQARSASKASIQREVKKSKKKGGGNKGGKRR